MRGLNNLISVSVLVFSLFVFSVKSKVIECDKSLLLNAKITEISEDGIKSESTTYKEFLEKFRGKSGTNFTVKIANENIREVCENSFEHVSGITVLNLTSNGINTLKPGCFFGNIALEVLDLSDNEIQEIKNGVFNDFRHLRDLVLSNNAISEIGSPAFGNLPALRHIRLDNNNIVILGRDWFQHSPNLRMLDLSHNRITAVGPRILDTIRPSCHTENSEIDSAEDLKSSPCPAGQRVDSTASGLTIDLSYNDIISVHPEAFEGLFYVYLLDLRYNKLISMTLEKEMIFRQIDLRNNLPNLRTQHFHSDNVIIERDEE